MKAARAKKLLELLEIPVTPEIDEEAEADAREFFNELVCELATDEHIESMRVGQCRPHDECWPVAPEDKSILEQGGYSLEELARTRGLLQLAINYNDNLELSLKEVRDIFSRVSLRPPIILEPNDKQPDGIRVAYWESPFMPTGPVDKYDKEVLEYAFDKGWLGWNATVLRELAEGIARSH